MPTHQLFNSSARDRRRRPMVDTVPLNARRHGAGPELAQAAAPVLLTSETLRWQGRTPSGCDAGKEQDKPLEPERGETPASTWLGDLGQVSLPWLIFLTSEADRSCPVLCSQVSWASGPFVANLLFLVTAKFSCMFILLLHWCYYWEWMRGFCFVLWLSYLVFKYFLIYLICLPLPTVEATFETTVALQGHCFFHFQVPISHRDRAVQSCKAAPPQKRESPGARNYNRKILPECLRASGVVMAGGRLHTLRAWPLTFREDLTAALLSAALLNPLSS